MEEKLELKHLAPYLPYEIRVTLIEEFFGKEKIEYEHHQRIDRVYFEYGSIKLHTEPFSKFESLDCYLLELRPLSYLTKEIEVNFKRFVPIEVLQLIDINLIFDIEILPFYKMQKLIEWKFDVFRLIDKNLAIAVTDKFNPYK
jgi:hypothetical protein